MRRSRDRKFYDRVKGSILYEKSDGTYVTLDEYLDGAKETNAKQGILYDGQGIAERVYLHVCRTGHRRGSAPEHA